MFAVHHHDEAGFLPLQEVLDDNRLARKAHLVAYKHIVNRSVRVLQRHRHYHPLTRSQAIRLNNDGSSPRVHISMGKESVAEGFISGCRDGVPLHESLRKGLRAF